MGFPSPAADYVESRISLDHQLIRHPSATYFMRAADSHHREGILQGALLVVDSSLTPVDGSLLVCAMEGEYRIKRYRKYPRQHLEDLSTGKKEALPVDDDGCTGSNAVFGVITHVINDVRSGEFDDCPVI
ncbi:TPA: S24 family peptidase [Escherichia coli]|uniref:HumD family translesion DNA polymerase n=1 Tax=Escherichia coli TaxID=562 RepID=UPI0019B64E00|nr:DNA repair protein [Escherichia coli]EGJ3636998.1 DNA repair protein [Escherichia coli]EGK5915846.1 DNA repair protein [Escherichia coli]EIA8067973.1 DNA repair protein [Escherichia coli]EIY2141764.1 DNA repair protein [Escherichia coli]